MRTVIVGIGNDFRGDDSAGLLAARRLKACNMPQTDVIELNGEVTRLLDYLPDRDTVILVDAVQSKSPPGTIHRFDASGEPLPESHATHSTHGLSVGSLLELARLQEMLPRKVIFYGIEVGSCGLGDAVTGPVERSILRVVDMVCADAQSLL